LHVKSPIDTGCVGGTPEEVAAFVRKEAALWKRVIP
jgi:hypothetical protein